MAEAHGRVGDNTSGGLKVLMYKVTSQQQLKPKICPQALFKDFPPTPLEVPKHVGQTRICATERNTNSNTHSGHFADRPWGGARDLQALGGLDQDHLSSSSRNPDGDVQPWCYVAETEEGIYWRYCDIPTCHSEWARLDKGGNAGLPQ